jgi:2-amino-4-hydroxy-6-hydroxymethyldihydropteridine diphosphokinase
VPIAYIALGSNIEFAGRTSPETIRAAMAALQSLGSVVAQSALYTTAPVGFQHQPAFVNAVVRVETGLSAERILKELLAIEHTFGRDRSSSMVNGPRTLDLDLLMLDQQIITTERLVLPHPRMAGRRFVLQPLVDIAAALRHPVLGQTMQQLLEQLPDEAENRPDGVCRLAGSAPNGNCLSADTD